MASTAPFYYIMDMLPITIRNRTITEEDIPSIQAIVNGHWDKGRTHSSKILCQEWNPAQGGSQWSYEGHGMQRGPSHSEAKRDYFSAARASQWQQPSAQPSHTCCIDRKNPTARGTPSQFPPVQLQPVRNTSFEPLYNSLIQQHHYLGYRQIVGNHLKYMAFFDEQPVVCLGWGSAPWGGFHLKACRNDENVKCQMKDAPFVYQSSSLISSNGSSQLIQNHIAGKRSAWNKGSCFPIFSPKPISSIFRFFLCKVFTSGVSDARFAGAPRRREVLPAKTHS